MRMRPPSRRSLRSGSRPLLAVLTAAALVGLAGSAEARLHPGKSELRGTVEGNGAPLAGYRVSLYASDTRGKPLVRRLGRDTTDGAGSFTIEYRRPPGLLSHGPVLYLLAEKGDAMLASAIGDVAKRARVVVNERTTVATAASFAQFVDAVDGVGGRRIRGNPTGMRNAVRMVTNMANPRTGDVGEVLFRSPNGDETKTYRTFNTLANIVASCVAVPANCELLFEYTTPPGGPAPTTVLQAMANTTRYPSNHVAELFDLAAGGIYSPVLDEAPSSWLLFLKFTGEFDSRYADTNLMSGPGNVAFDEHGFAWINDNYVPSANDVTSCAGLRLMKFFPWGETFPGSPHFGGGLSGAGFGISIDPRDRIWVGNFGFEAPACTELDDPRNKVPATHDSISAFRPNGSPISGFEGFTDGHIWWPQATVSDPKGNVWVANCGNDTVTLVPRGIPRRARNIALPDGQGSRGHYRVELPNRPLIKPFAIAIDPKGRAWVTGNRAGHVPDTDVPAGRVYRISSDGEVETLPHTNRRGDPVLSWPMGISGDSRGNMWVSNSDSVNVPCVTPLDPQDGAGPSIAFYPADGGPPIQYAPPGDAKASGGISIPWGNAIDGDDTLWVFNFGRKPTKDVEADTTWPDTSLSHFCGADVSKCPAGLRRGEPISPSTGYVSDALDRITGGGIDPSGNVWLLNNWKKTGPFQPVYDTNPGGNSFVIVPGAAAPVTTPLIGPPVPFDTKPNRRPKHAPPRRR